MDQPNEAFYESIKEELKPVLPMLGKAAETVVDQGVSNYPILVMAKEAVQIGIRLVDGGEEFGEWYVHISTLEEFSTKNLIQEDRLGSFKEVYKTPLTHLCLFIIKDGGATFAFIPRNQ